MKKMKEKNARELMVELRIGQVETAKRKLAEARAALESAKKTDPKATVTRCIKCGELETPYWACAC